MQPRIVQKKNFAKKWKIKSAQPSTTSTLAKPRYARPVVRYSAPVEKFVWIESIIAVSRGWPKPPLRPPRLQPHEVPEGHGQLQRSAERREPSTGQVGSLAPEVKEW